MPMACWKKHPVYEEEHIEMMAQNYVLAKNDYVAFTTRAQTT